MEIEILNYGEFHEHTLEFYFLLGDCYFEINEYNEFILNYDFVLKINKTNIIGVNKIAQCYEALKDKVNALNYYIQSAEIRKEDPDAGLEHEATKEAISNAKRLAKELDKENELPEWIKNTN